MKIEIPVRGGKTLQNIPQKVQSVPDYLKNRNYFDKIKEVLYYFSKIETLKR